MNEKHVVYPTPDASFPDGTRSGVAFSSGVRFTVRTAALLDDAVGAFLALHDPEAPASSTRHRALSQETTQFALCTIKMERKSGSTHSTIATTTIVYADA